MAVLRATVITSCSTPPYVTIHDPNPHREGLDTRLKSVRPTLLADCYNSDPIILCMTYKTSIVAYLKVSAR